MNSITADDLDQSVGFLCHDIARLMAAEYNHMVAPLGLTRTQWRVIVYLHRQDGLSQVALARMLGTGKVAVGTLVSRLERDGWVQRRVDPGDRRTKRVFLTGKSRKMDGDMIRTGKQLTGLSLGGLSHTEQRELIRLLQAVKRNLLEVGQSNPDRDSGD
ncbi:MAG: MarR family transcriptional regulator [Pseudomonadales bacterium]|jgi:DNA-binding MarR family transcriptional regulator|nr:MarR family transcriptional regulator [Pseudomonadales bacterium]MDP6469479.1 MarR family transcriptional regulator [Pseudomonadales bacterium]MDP6827321.1 MarR family transcriptional regulator [Pseudomonadales bacterium]MDP6971144.1 MarR family transcriptional regulator [Pseudomonadales bacterium]|tara:strand:- start:224 stop:700 length:477 start_codon:yes stop_codon:yes gene_type:complete